MMLSLFAFLSGAQLAAAACSRDNCLRAIIASTFPQRQGSADCASYFFQDATGIPAYASACSGLVRYSSACSCIGVTNSLPIVVSITSSTTSESTTVSTATSSTSSSTTSTTTTTMSSTSATLTTTKTTTSSTSSSTASTTTTTMSSTSATLTTTTTTTSSTTTTTGSSPLSSWADLGCYDDPERDIFSGAAQKTTYPTPFTLQSCAADCAGFVNFAVADSAICVCFNFQYYLYEVSVPQSSCDVPCQGDPATYCGGTDFYEFYQSESVP